MIGNAYVLRFATIGAGVKGVERNAEVCVGVFDNCQLLANCNIKSHFFPNLPMKGLHKRFSLLLFAARKFP